MPRGRHFLLWGLCLVVVLLASVFGRPDIPIDETRYVSVAWEMVSRGDWIVLHKNGEPYHHKPPLLFWLIGAGWSVLGVSDWWPRVVNALASLVCLGLTAAIARRLWPGEKGVGERAGWLLLGGMLWLFFSTSVMFDILLCACVLLALLAALRAWQGESRGTWGLFGVALGLGILAKGPVVLLHVLPPLLLVKWWGGRESVERRWWIGIGLGTLLGAAIALTWAIPAAIQGGDEFRRAIFWGQTAGRVTGNLAHKQPVWFYLPILPVLLFPWLLWASGWRAVVEAVRSDRRPSRIMTAAAFDNAIRVLHAVAGSTNAIVHLVALAGRVGVDLPLRRFDELSRSTPTLVNLKPTGSYLMEDFYYAGGVAALCRELGELLDLTASGITGATLADLIASAKNHNPDVLRPRSNPMHSDGGLAVLTGSLAPGGAVIKQSAASPRLLQHRGRAVVFEDHDDLLARIDSPDLDVTADDILVMKGGGPVGGPGMPEWGFLPIPAKLLRAGVRDMVRLSDARMSGTAFGTVVVHVTPESAVGGPLAAVRNGDWIELDVPNRKLNLLIEDDKLEQRLAEQPRRRDVPARGYARLFHEHVLQADRGCDFDFLVGRDGPGE